jgi:hypothetical protein
MDAASYNRDLDQRLSVGGAVDAALFSDFLNAFNDSASSNGWLEAKVQVLRQRIARGGQVTVHERTANVELSTSEAFEGWVRRHFPGLERSA